MTLTVGALTLLIAACPAASELLQFSRARFVAGEFWRLASCHLTHWNWEHLQWDLLMFVVLGAICEMRNSGRMVWCVLAAATCVSLLVLGLFPDIETYRGLSGVDTALFTLLAIDLLREAWVERRRTLAIVVGGALIGFAAKTAYEAVAGCALFVDQQQAGFNILVWDHILAAAVGSIIALRSPNAPAVKRMCEVPFHSPIDLEETRQVLSP
jgi:rhomboid family GlyGly-CTERM serine protease